jgi:hypothetical protein
MTAFRLTKILVIDPIIKDHTRLQPGGFLNTQNTTGAVILAGNINIFWMKLNAPKRLL